jgi:hypothetical protein
VSGSKWAAQILNGTASAVTYTVSAKARANPSLTKATVLNVSGGDARNGSYRVYAANALQYQLTLDFNANVYTFVNQDGSAPVTDTFNTDSSEPGTYFFKTSRVASVANTSRFRVTTDAVVGNFPFIGPFRHRQYLCGQALHRRSQAGHQPGAVGRHLQPARHPTHGQRGDFADHADGDLVRRHGAKALRRLDYLQHPELPARFGGDLHGQRDGDPGVWGIVNNANPAENGRFAMAFIGDQKVYLSAGAAPSTPGMLVWRLAVQDTPVWAAATGHGGSTKGSWASINMTATGNTRSVINADGTTAAHANTYGGMGAQGPAGMRQFPDGTGSTYFATYNTKLFTLVGASNVTTGGYLQLNLLD